MNSYMNILVRVSSGRAQAQIKAMQAQMAGLRAETVSMSRTQPFGAAAFSSLTKFGSRLQWVGRQLQYNFTLPILLAGGAAVKFAMDQEKSFTHVAKVYGDTASAAKQFRKESDGAMSAAQAHSKALHVQTQELNALDEAFTAISDHYGVAKKDVLDIAGAWAAAGASGERLAKSVNDTMVAMIIGDMDATKATDSLISIQAQYNLSSKELMQTLATLNNVENQTGISMGGLIDGFARAAGVARSAGVDVNHLAAMLAALVPATGSAANAGNALKTIFSRLMAPTQESAQVMNEMGLNIESTSWQAATGAERLQIMQKAFEALGSSAKVVASSVIASRWQINKFEVLMNELGSTTGFYAKGLAAASDAGNNFKVMQSELNTVLESDPRQLQRMWVILQNASVKIIQPMIPYIIYLAQEIGNLAQAFANLDPHVQKLVLLGLTLLALVGPLVRYLGAIKILIGITGTSVSYLVEGLMVLGKVIIGLPFKLARMGFTMLFSMISLLVPESLATSLGTMSIWKGLGFFFATWTKVVNAIFAEGNIARAKIWLAGLVFQAKVAAIWAGEIVGIFLASFTRLREIYVLETALMGSRWAGMWAALKSLSVVGWITQLSIWSKGGAIIALTRNITLGIQVMWAAMWAEVKVISLAGWGMMRAVWVAQAIVGVGIFTRMRSALVTVWATTAALGSKIWMIMGESMVAISRATVLGTIAVFKGLIPFLLRFGKFFISWPAVLIGIVLALFFAFKDQIGQIFQNIASYIQDNFGAVGKMFDWLGNKIMSVFNMLPSGVQNAMIAVVKTVEAAAKAVYGWFSYLNPFASHSPSLVDNVTKGMGEVVKQFSTLGQIKKYTTAAYNEISRFGKLTRGLGINAQQQQQREDRQDIKKAGGGGAALASYNKLTGILNKLNPILNKLNAQMQAQQRIVDGWQSKVDLANRKLDVQQNLLDKLQDKLSGYQDKLSAAQDRLDKFASAPLKGMQDMNDQIEANTVAQNKLKLAMMNMEDAVGPLDDIQKKLDAINGAQEMLRGQREALRSAGAGSNILKGYDDQIAALDQQKLSYQSNATALNDMQDQLDALGREADRLDLVKSLKFDDLQYQIEKAANTIKEMSFDQIMKGVQGAQADIKKYGDRVDAASAAVARQQAVVDRLTKARDQLQQRLDAEQRTLDKITDRYNKVNDAISAINDSLQSVVASADKVNQALADKKAAKKKGTTGSAGSISPGLANFRAAGNANFPDPGGLGIGPRKNWHSQVKGIDKFTEQLSQDTADMFAQINPFTPLKDKAVKVWDWIKKKTNDIAPGLFKGISKAWDGIFAGVDSGSSKAFMEDIRGIGKFITQVLHDISKGVGHLWDLFGPDIVKIAKGIWHGFQDIWKQISPEIKKFGPLTKPLGKAIQNVWKIIKPIFAVFSLGAIALGKLLTSVVSEVIGPLLHDLGSILAQAIRVIRGFFELIIGILTLNKKMIWQGIKDIFGGLVKLIWDIITGASHVIWNVFQGLVKGIAHWFEWLWDVLFGHSIIPDMVDAFFEWFGKLAALPKWIWSHVLKPIFDWVKKMWKDHISPLMEAEIRGWKLIWHKLVEIGKWVWEHVLKPIFDKIKDLWTKVHDELIKWWDRIVNTWHKLQALGNWVWTNVFQPIIGRAKNAWDNVKSELDKWWDRIKNVWDDLTNLGHWFKENVMDKVFNAITGVWDDIKNFLTKNKDMLVGPMKGIVNGMISAVDTIINGLNKISDVLPGPINWHIDPIDKLAAGGRMANRGFKTHGARAIVGEGKANYPEYVIPTDPTYRNRAKSLMTQAMSRMGLRTGESLQGALGDTAKDVRNVMASHPGEVPQLGIGGWISSNFHNATGWFKGKAMDLVAKMTDPALDAAASLVKKAGWDAVKPPPLYGIGKMRDWIGGVNDAFNTANQSAQDRLSGGPKARRALKFAKSQVGDPYVWGGVGPNGFDCSGFQSAITNVLRGQDPYHRVGSTASFPWPGFHTGWSPQAKGYTIGSTKSYAGGVGHMAGTLAGVNVESRGGTGVIVGSRARGYNDPGFDTHAYLSLARGGVALANRGPVYAKMAEAGHDEAVVPLPRGWRDTFGKGGNTYNFNGDLSFPNVKSGADAKTFIDNLESLAKD